MSISGSLIARTVFLPIEEASFDLLSKEHAAGRPTSPIFACVLKVVMLIGLSVATLGVPSSSFIVAGLSGT